MRSKNQRGEGTEVGGGSAAATSKGKSGKGTDGALHGPPTIAGGGWSEQGERRLQISV